MKLRAPAHWTSSTPTRAAAHVCIHTYLLEMISKFQKISKNKRHTGWKGGFRNLIEDFSSVRTRRDELTTARLPTARKKDHCMARQTPSYGKNTACRRSKQRWPAWPTAAESNEECAYKSTNGHCNVASNVEKTCVHYNTSP